MEEKKNWYDGVPAPVDKDGNVVPLATRTLYDGDGQEVIVMEYALIYSKYTGVQVWRVMSSDGSIFMLDRCHLERPDSWERLEKDIQKTAGNDVCGYYDKAGKPCGDCPAHHTQDKCLLVAMRDVMRRTKALAERDAND